MKLLRYGPKGRERPGLLDARGRIRDLSAIIRDIDGAVLSPRGLARLAKVKPESLPLVKGAPRLGPPVAAPQKFLAIGLNYSDHAAETGAALPKEPIIFTKAVSCLSGPHDDLTLPPKSKKTDWEVELGLVIGTTAKNVAKKDALSHVAGYVLVNDVSEREFQIERGGQWTKGKSYDSFGPVGPWLATADEIPDPQAVTLWLEVNGRRMQQGSTATMIFGVAEIVAYVSRFMTLHPGDIITTGTPPGVGMARKPPRFLKPGDEVTLGGDGLGEQAQRVVRDRE